eukprot:183631-Rhodomonas_salina.1
MSGAEISHDYNGTIRWDALSLAQVRQAVSTHVMLETDAGWGAARKNNFWKRLCSLGLKGS